MRYSAQGFIPLFLLLIAGVIVGGTIWITSQTKQVELTSPTSLKVNENKIYEDSELNFKFEYPYEFEVVNESEEQYSERTKTKYRKNFKYYVAYEPPKFVKGIIVKPKDLKLSSNQFEQVPLTVWIFENPENLNSKSWYKDFWYYPFVWGIYDVRKAQIEPSSGAAEVSYQPGKPKFILIPKEDSLRGASKMFLFKIMEKGDKILDSFKFND